MGSGSSKDAQEDTCSPEQTTLDLALEQADRRANQPKGNESEKQNDDDEKPSIFLPDDIWQKVAKHMTTKEWVRASGTCKAMFKVQVSSIDLESYSANAVVWAARHSRKFETVQLKLYMWREDKSRDVLAAVYPDDWDLRQVHTLCVSLDPWPSGDSLLKRVVPIFFVPDDDPKRWMWLSEMLSSACNAKEMYLKGEGMGGPAVNRCGVPRLVHLTHLGVTTHISPYMTQSIQQLPALRHLSISKGPVLQDMEALLPLNLTRCSALQDLTLENVLPGNLRFSPGVKLHLIWRDSPALLESWGVFATGAQLSR